MTRGYLASPGERHTDQAGQPIRLAAHRNCSGIPCAADLQFETSTPKAGAGLRFVAAMVSRNGDRARGSAGPDTWRIETSIL